LFSKDLMKACQNEMIYYSIGLTLSTPITNRKIEDDHREHPMETLGLIHRGDEVGSGTSFTN
jgi:hypothetical protein